MRDDALPSGAGLQGVCMFPSAMIKSHNPLYEYECQQMRWISDPKQLKRFTVGVLLAAFVLAIVLAFVFHINLNALPRRVTPIFGVTSAVSIVTTAIMIMLGLYYMAVPMRSINQDVNTGKWDGLRLTMIGEENIVWAKYAIAQARVWRYMVLFIAFQIVITMLNFSFVRYIPDNSLPFWMFSRGISLVQAVLEPLWIMQGLTALGVALGLRIRRQSTAILGVFLCIVAVELAQLYMASAVGLLIRPLFYFGGRFGRTQLQQPVFQIIVPTLTLFASYGFYSLIRRVSLFTAFRAAYTVEGDSEASGQRGRDAANAM